MIDTKRPSLLTVAIISSLVGLCSTAPVLLSVYRQHTATKAWLAWPRPGVISYSVFVPGCHREEFLGMMRAYGLEEGDPPERFIAVFGEPDSVTDEPRFGQGVKCYTWKNECYYWPQRKGIPLVPQLPPYTEFPNKGNPADETVVRSSALPGARAAPSSLTVGRSQSRR